MDGVGGTEIMLIDGEGCPTDPSIMVAMANAKGNGQTLEAQFDAFKFPTSETVAFRALVTPCIPHCEPVHCQNRVFDGTLYEAESFGKRRRRRRKRSALLSGNSELAASSGKGVSAKLPAPEEVVVRNSIEIKDKFFLDEEEDDLTGSGGSKSLRRTAYELAPANDLYQFKVSDSFLKLSGFAMLLCALLLGQSILFVGWTIMWRRRRSSSSSSALSSAASVITER